MSDEVTEIRGTFESAIPEGGVVLVTFRDGDGYLRSAAGDFRSTARALEDSGIRPGDPAVFGVYSWGGLAYFGPDEGTEE